MENNLSLIEQLEEATKGVMECKEKRVVNQDEVNRLTLQCIKEIGEVLKQLYGTI